MKDYYYLIEKNQKGPFTIEELHKQNINDQTLIWYDGIENWTPLRDIPELSQINRKVAPPPVPNENSDELKANQSANLKPINKKVLFWVVAWCGFHLFALITSYSRLDFFNDGGEPKSNKFWPFVDIYEKLYSYYSYPNEIADTTYLFRGVFVEYDWS